MRGFPRPSVTTLETPTLRLEPLALHHVDSLWESVQSSLDQLREWLPWAVNPTIEETREFAKTCEADWAENKSWTFVILKGQHAIGTIGLADAEPMTRRAELGYWMRTSDVGKGLMTEAGTAVVEFGFSELNLHRIELEAGTENPGSLAVAAKLGFKREGLARQSGFAANGYYDCVRFGMLSSDPRPYEKSGARV